MDHGRFGFLDRPAFWCAVTGLAGLLLSLPLLAMDFWSDQGIFATIADTLLDGGVAYRDAWEHKPPGIFAVYGFAFLVLGRQIWAVRGIEMAALAAASAGLFWVGDRRFGSRAAGILAGILLPLMYVPFGPNTAQPESFQIPLLIWAWALWPQPEMKDRGVPLRLFSAGLLLSLATLFKTPAGLFGVLFLVDLVLTRRKIEGSANMRIGLACFLGGIVGPLLLVSAYYGLRGAFAPFWDALVTYPSEYARAGVQPFGFHLDQFWRWTGWLTTPLELVLLACGTVAGFRRDRLETARCGVLFVAAWTSVILQARYFQYHYLVLLPFLSTMMSLTLVSPREAPAAAGPARMPRLRMGFLAISAGLLAWSIFLRLDRDRGLWASLGAPATVEGRTGWPPASAPWANSRSLAQRVRARTQPNDRIFVWGDEPLVYFLSGRRMAGSYPHLMTLVPEWRGPERLHGLLERFETGAPKLIVVGRGQLWWRRYQTPRVLLEIYPDMKRMLEDRYRLAETDDGYDFWIRID